MAASKPYLHLRPDKICVICNAEIVRKKDATCMKVLKTIKEHALKWTKLKIPDGDSCKEFPNAYLRLANLTEATMHQNCSLNLRLRYKNYSHYLVDENVLDSPMDAEASTSDTFSSPPPTTRSTLSSPSQKENCFVCDHQESTEKTFRISKSSLAEETKSNMAYHLKQGNSPYHTAAKRLNLMLCGTTTDIYAADVHYHRHCLIYFNRVSKEKDATKQILIDVVKDIFNAYIRVRIVKEQNAYLLTDLLKDSILMSEEHGVEPIFSGTKSLRRHIEDNVKEVSFHKISKSLIAYPTDIDPIMYTESTLKGHGLRQTDIMASFAKTIHRIVDEYADTNDPIEWPISADKLIDAFENDKPIVELYNIISMTIKRKCISSIPLNKYGFAKIESKNIANKVWSLANDWTTLITGRKNAKQITISMCIHRLTSCKEVIKILDKAGHGISYNNVLLQNEDWASSIDAIEILDGLLSNTVTHSSLDNNDMRQDTLTGKCTSHHTNFLIFQPKPPIAGKALVTTGRQIEHNPNNNLNEADYKLGKPVPPQPMPHYWENESTIHVDKCFGKDLLWSLAGGLSDDDTMEPLPLLGSWTAFNKVVCDVEVSKSLLTYLPANENPPEYPVCKEYLNFILEVTGLLDLQYMFVHADEQVYARILHLIWKHKEYFGKIIPLMGGFHQLRVFQKILYKRHNVVGYQRWYSDAGVIAGGSAAQAFEGRHYFRSMRLHKEGFDALAQTRINKITNNYNDLDPTLVNNLKELRKDPSDVLVQSIVNSDSFVQLLKDFQSVEGLRGKMTMQYLKDVSLMLCIVSAVREDSFDRHLEAERQFLKLVFAFDHINYSRYNTYQHVYLTSLKNTNNAAYSDLRTHGFGCTSTDNEKFSTKHGDLETEHFNKETKGTAGPFRSGYSTDMHAVTRWIKTSHIHSKLRNIVKNRFHLLTSTQHKELTPRNKKNHKAHVDSLKEKLQEYNTDPFGVGSVRNISTGKEVDDMITTGLLTADKTGDEQYKRFVHDRLVTGEISIFQSISKNKIKTCPDIPKKRSKKVDVLVEEKQAFGVMLSRCKNMEEAFSFPITSYPLSIALPNGGIYQGDKAAFRNWLIGKHHDEQFLTESVWIFDAGYVFRQIKSKETYREFFRAILKWMIMISKDARPLSIVIAIDDYRADSTKELERRSRRLGYESRRVTVTGLEQHMPKGEEWSDFLTNGDNKNDLMSLFGIYINDREAKRIADGIPLIFCGKSVALDVTDYTCNHEEADTKIPLMASKLKRDAVIVAEDTDVLILLVTAFATTNSHCQWQMRYKDRTYANIGKICDNLGTENSSLLIPFHAITGCDTTSFFYRRGKTIPFKTAIKKGKLNLLKSLGSDLKVSEEELSNCKEFIRTVIYGGMDNETYLDTRIRLYNEQAKKSTLAIPPDQDSCIRHIYRAHLITYIWRMGCQLFEIPNIDPLQYCWNICDGILTPTWFLCSQFPPSLSSKRKHRDDGYEADNEPVDADDEEKCDQKKTVKRKSKKMVISHKCTSNETPGQKFRKTINRKSFVIEEMEDEMGVATVEESVSEEREADSMGITETSECYDDWEHYSDFFQSSETTDSDWM